MTSAIAERLNLTASTTSGVRNTSCIRCRRFGQRILALVQGYDLNDHDHLRKDSLFGASLGCVESKRSDCEAWLERARSTGYCRRPVAMSKSTAKVDFARLDRLLVELFVDYRGKAPDRIVLDIDATDFELHGGQEHRFYHGYYREYCYMPLLVLCDDFPVMVRLDAAAGVEDLLEQVVSQLRGHWPDTHITVGFCRDQILCWCERTPDVDYVIGIAKNNRLNEESIVARNCAALEAGLTGEATRRFCEFEYRTLDTWSRKRRVICKAEALPEHCDESQGHFVCKDNARYIVTSLDTDGHPGRQLYEQFYCQRGDAENRLREVKVDLFAKRCSSNLFDANALRLYLSAIAQVCSFTFAAALSTSLANCQPATIRVKLLKIGGQVKRSARRIHVALSSAFAHQAVFFHAWRNIAPT